MKEITAIIQPHTLSRVMQALHALPHFPGITLLEDARGQGRGRGAGGTFRLTEDNIAFHSKTLLLVTCAGQHADSIVAAIAQHARTGNPGDGLVTVKDVAHAVRIRTGETGENAV